MTHETQGHGKFNSLERKTGRAYAAVGLWRKAGRQDLITGGMPRAVLEFVETKSLLTVPDVQNKIINDYEIIAIEVKTGTRTKSKSLNMFVTKYKPSYSIRISAKNFGFENNIKSVPLHAVFCI